MTRAADAACEAALRGMGVPVARLRLFAALDCEVWRVRTRDGAELALRVYPPSKSELAPIEAEVAWLRAAAEDGLHVPRPLADADGRFIRAWQPDPGAPARHALLLTWLTGRMHDRGLTPARLRRVGVLTGRLHALSANLAREDAFATPRLYADTDLAGWAAGTRAGSQALGAGLRAHAARAAGVLARELEALPRDESSWGFIHGDLHPWNLLFERDVAGAIDFSDCGWGHRAFDLASTLQWLRFPWAGNHDAGADGYARLRDALLEGYASAMPLPPRVEHQLELHLRSRLLLTLEWMLDDWPALDHRPWAPRFLANCEAEFAG